MNVFIFHYTHTHIHNHTNAQTYLSENLLCASKIEERSAVEVINALFDRFLDDFDVILDRDAAKNGAQLSAT